MHGIDNLDSYRDIESRDCKNAFEAKNFVDEILSKGFEVRLKRQKKDYETIIMIELYFEKQKKVK